MSGRATIRSALRRALSAVLISALIWSVPAAAEPVGVIGAAEDGLDRLIFAWPGPVEYSAERFGDTLMIRFTRPIEGPVAEAASGLSRFVRSARIGSDGRSVIVELTGNHRMRTDRNGNQVVVDLMARGTDPVVAAPVPAPAPPASPPPPATPAAAQSVPPAASAAASQASASTQGSPELGVRIGRHPDYDRIVFDWNAPVEFTVTPGAGEARVQFSRPARIDDAEVRRDLPEALRGFASQTTGDGTVATIPVPTGRSVDAFRSGSKVVVDVRRDGKGQAVAKASPAATPAQPLPPASANPAPATTNAPSATAKPDPAAKVPPATAPAPRTAATPPAPAPLSAPTPRIADTAPLPPARAPGAAGASSSEPAATAPAADPPPQPGGVVSFARAGTGTISGPPLPVVASIANEALSIRFEWPDPVAAVVFPRAGYVWVAFDREATLDFSPMTGVNNQIAGQPEQIPVDIGSALRIPVVEGVNPRVWRDGNTWVLDLQPQASRPDVPLRVDAQMVSPQGPRLFISIEGVGRPIVALDPEVGDGLFMIPITTLSRGIDGDRTYPELTILASVQGVVVRPRLDGVEVRVLPDGVALTTEGGLLLSGPAPRTGSEAFSGRGFAGMPAGLPPGRIFDMSNWRLGDAAAFQEQRQALQLRISEATSISRSGPRLELAQFYFARGLAAEAIGLLRTIEQSDEDLAKRPDVKALRGASDFMLGRYAEASAGLADPNLNGFSEAELWRGASAAAQGLWNEAVEHFARAGEIPGGYPRNYTTELALLAAEAAIRAGDYRGAGSFLDVIAEGAPTPAEKARIDFLRARVLMASGDEETALEIWRVLADGEDRWARVRSERALIEDALAKNKISTQEAADRLDLLRYAWRGDRLEFELLRELGKLRLGENDYEQGLDALRQAVTFFPNNPETREAAQDLTKTFSDIFTQGAVEGMTPLQALALYDEFRELTPVGQAGDKIIEGLADRLVRVDLLDRAARLLDRQVKFRLQGVEKARVGARLAVIHLLDRQPDSAIKALDESVAPGLSESLAQERRRLRSRAIFELGDAQGALKLLEGDSSREADFLLADIHWRTQNWVEAAKVFRKLVGNAGLDGSRIKPDAAQFILNWAVSLSLSENAEGLNRLRQLYSSQMDNTPYREAFRLITNSTTGQPDDFMRLTERFEEIGQFQAFLSSYRDKLKEGTLSATN
ncbi:tetratricopeptide repeat protein [Thalassobaculum sp.]|uniref:tetratricopeptide repeat protein n=1 Tax=Thalassobaculum sp. TaxID=2022740 RepID=UPI0032EED562